MKEVDFTKCRFIRNELSYTTYYDFCKNARCLKAYYKLLEDDAKIFYKWYVYANIFMGEVHKNFIWNYLNNEDDEYYTVLINNLSTSYKK